MKIRNILLTLAVIVTAVLTSCSGASKKSDGKTLVVYFSATGTTKNVAEQIAKATGADILEIVPEQSYTKEDLDWSNKLSRSCLENDNLNARPAIKKSDVKVSDYDTIILGYPIWWDLCPRIVNTFIESNDLKGKTVMPFATSGRSGVDGSVNYLKTLYPDVNWTKGRLFNEFKEQDVRDWIGDWGRECGVTDSRIMGGGFGGCTINLFRKELRDKFVETAKAKFNEKYGHEPKVYDFVISDGAHKENPNL